MYNVCNQLHIGYLWLFLQRTSFRHTFWLRREQEEKYHYFPLETTLLWKQGHSYWKYFHLIKRIQTLDSMIRYQMWPWKCKEWLSWKGNLSFHRNSTPFILAACLLMCWYTFCLEDLPAFIWMTQIPWLVRE